MQVTVQQLAVEAAVRGSKEIALQALLIDPVVNSTDAAVRLLDEMLGGKPTLHSSVHLTRKRFSCLGNIDLAQCRKSAA